MFAGADCQNSPTCGTVACIPTATIRLDIKVTTFSYVLGGIGSDVLVVAQVVEGLVAACVSSGVEIASSPFDWVEVECGGLVA